MAFSIEEAPCSRTGFFTLGGSFFCNESDDFAKSRQSGRGI
jgi:hypothetical protein